MTPGTDGGGAAVDAIVAHAEDDATIARCMEVWPVQFSGCCIIPFSLAYLLMRGILQLMKLNSECIGGFPKLVVLSTLLTWAGGRGGAVSGDIEDFKSRVPAVGAANVHATENALFSMHAQGFNVHVIGVGLVYGYGGCDFESLFR